MMKSSAASDQSWERKAEVDEEEEEGLEEDGSSERESETDESGAMYAKEHKQE
jgi:hypothetical protein